MNRVINMVLLFCCLGFCQNIDSYENVILPSTGKSFFEYLISHRSEMDSLSVCSFSGRELEAVQLAINDYKQQEKVFENIDLFSFSVLKINSSIIYVYIRFNTEEYKKKKGGFPLGGDADYLIDLHKMRVLEKKFTK